MADQQEQETGQKLLLDLAWERQQKKTFTAWCNSHLRKAGQAFLIEEINEDFKDGIKLLKLLEIISGEKLPPKETKGKMRIHKINNINQVLDFIGSKGVRLVGISAEEICDGSLKMTLGMIWTIILRFAIQDISVEEMSAKEGLLLWCQRKTAPYKNVNVQNFHTSFKDGLAFCALIHRHRPELIDYDSLRKANDMDNLNLAFEVADKHLDIPKMLDAEDIHNTIKPDERAIMTYVSSYYHAFSSSQQAEQAAKRIGKVLDVNKENQKLMEEYEQMASDLLEWIRSTMPWLEDKTPEHTLQKAAENLEEFRQYSKVTKPPKAEERARLEAHFHTLQTKLRVSGRPAYVPSEGKLVTDIAHAWKGLEGGEKAKQEFLQNELIRLERLERLAATFERKANVLEKWVEGQDEPLKSNDEIVAADLPEANALLKKLETFESDLEAHSDRLDKLDSIIKELTELNYHRVDAVTERKQGIHDRFDQLRDLSAERKARIQAAIEEQQRLDSMRVDYAKRAALFNNWMDNVMDDLDESFKCHTIRDVEELKAQFEEFKDTTLKEGNDSYESLNDLAQQLAQASTADNPYTSHTPTSVYEKWCKVLEKVPQREAALENELQTQTYNEELRVQFAEKANAIGEYIEQKNQFLADVSTADRPLEETVQVLKSLNDEAAQYQPQLDECETVHQTVQAALVFDNPHTQYTMETLRANWSQLLAAINRNINEIENQMLLRDSRGITEQQMQEYRSSFNHFDKDGSGQLDKNEFRACLLSLGYNLSGDPTNDPEFEKVWVRVDPNTTGYVSFEAFVSFMTDETVDKDTADQVMQSFKVLAGDKPYITEDELRRELPPEQADYCIQRMAPYTGPGTVDGALDYQSFSSALYGQSEL